MMPQGKEGGSHASHPDEGQIGWIARQAVKNKSLGNANPVPEDNAYDLVNYNKPDSRLCMCLKC